MAHLPIFRFNPFPSSPRKVTSTTRLQRLGVDYEVRQALLGHKMPGMTAAYSHGGPEWDAKLREAVKRLEKAYPVAYGTGGGYSRTGATR